MEFDCYVKDSHGIPDFLDSLPKDDRDYLIQNYFMYSEYLTLKYDTDTKQLTIVPRPI